MSDLKLPLQVGKWYRRADGKYVQSSEPVSSWGVSFHNMQGCIYERTSGRTTDPAPAVQLVAGPFDTGLTLPLVSGRWYALPDGAITVAAKPCETNRHTPGVWVGNRGYDAATGECCAMEPGAAAKYALRDACEAAMPAPAAHPHAAAMLEYAKDAAAHAEPWLLWEWCEPGYDYEWRKCDSNPRWTPRCQYRRKPRTIRIGEHDVPEPLREATEGQEVYLSLVTGTTGFSQVVPYKASYADWLRRGLLFATPEGADAAARAVIGVLGGEV